MKIPSFLRHPNSRRGAALVIVLAFVVLVTGLVVAFFSRAMNERGISNSSANQSRAELFAQGALETITSDLKAEIAAGSTSLPNPNPNNYPPIYVPKAVAAGTPSPIVPSRVGTNSIFPTLVKRSASTVPFYTGAGYDITGYPPSNRASSVSSTVASSNGRAITLARWNKPLLLPKKTLSSDTDFTPFDTAPNAFVAPDWIFVARDGSHPGSSGNAASFGSGGNTADNPAPSNTKYITGRYGYTIYDESALLDMNVAGYPSALPASTSYPGTNPDNLKNYGYAAKGALAYADLAQLPGIASLTVARQAEVINGIVGWRNYASVSPPGTFPYSSTSDWTAGAQGKNYFDYIRKNTTGFLQTANTSLVGGQSDKLFPSRQSLITLLLQGIATNATERANLQNDLQYMGTFSRAMNVPTWTPTATAPPTTTVLTAIPPGNTIDYVGQADVGTSANRNLVNLRYPTATPANTSISHYKDDASSVNYTVSAGDPVLQSRWSLARLDWLKDGNPNTGSGPLGTKAAAIKACFGLVWDYPGNAGNTTSANGGNKCWNYVGAAGNLTTPPGKIKILAEVAGEGREPDFFELLKAAILRGSLGKDVGPACFDNGYKTSDKVYSYITATNKYYYGEYSFYVNSDEYRLGTADLYNYTFGPNSSSAPPKAPARIPDVQIFRIGASIIDQYDADSYPTAIYFRYQEVEGTLDGSTTGNYDPAGGNKGNPIFGPVTMAYGMENLPYLNSVRQIIAYPNTGVQQIGGWRQPVLWNPHQAPLDNNNVKDRPANYEIRAYGKARTYWIRDGDAGAQTSHGYGAGLSQDVDYFTASGIQTAEGTQRGTITFSLAAPESKSAFCFYDKPWPLLQSMNNGDVTATSPFAGNLATSSMPNFTANMDKDSVFTVPNKFVAFSTGVTDTSDAGVEPYRPIYPHGTDALTGEGRGASGGANTYTLGWSDASGRFHPYSFLTGAFPYFSVKENNYSDYGTVFPYGLDGGDVFALADPRTGRFGLGKNIYDGLLGTLSVFSASNKKWAPRARPKDASFVPSITAAPYWFYLGDTMVNSSTNTTFTNYYKDPDGVVRPGDGYYGDTSTGDGFMTFFAGSSSSAVPGDTVSSTHGRKPLILNRPFRSVGELGYVYRDLPFKTLDLFTPYSADSALLDIFSINDEARISNGKIDTVSAGQVNLNNAPAPVIQAILGGGSKKESESAYNLTGNQPKLIAQNIAKQLAAGVNPLLNRADLVNKLGSDLGYDPTTVFTGVNPVRGGGSFAAPSTVSADKANKAYLESPLRALSNVVNTRTWNLLIDVVAQTGRMKSGAAALTDFLVEGEKRYWLHIAIDRYSGKVIDQQLEPVYE